jgi:hypothetical protein
MKGGAIQKIMANKEKVFDHFLFSAEAAASFTTISNAPCYAVLILYVLTPPN